MVVGLALLICLDLALFPFVWLWDGSGLVLVDSGVLWVGSGALVAFSGLRIGE